MPNVVDISKWMNIRNAGERDTVIDIDGEIGLAIDWVEFRLKPDNTKEFIKNLLKDVPQTAQHRIKVEINSLGGNANDGFSIHDYLADHPATVTTLITGFSASAATIIAQSASKGRRQMSSNAFYLIHRGQNGIWGNALELESALGNLNNFDTRLSELYARRSDRDPSEFLELMNKNNGNGIWLNADEALEYGLIDEIVEPQKVARIQNRTEIFNKLGFPELPEIDNNSNDMTREELQNLFDGFKGEIKNLINSRRQGEGGQEIRILDEEEVQNRLTEMENTISENTVSNEEHNQVVQARDTAETERNSAISERDTAQNRVSELETEVTNLQNEVARLGGKPTPLNLGEDPDPQQGNKGKTKNEQAAEANAAVLRKM